MTPAITTVIGPVGPETWDGVPPNSAAWNPTNIAPYKPATGPAPGGDAERERERQRHHRGGQPAIDIAAQIVESQPVDQGHLGSQNR